MPTRKASIKETGEELSPAEWERFDAAVAEVKGERDDGTTPGAPEERQHGATGEGRSTSPGREDS